MRRACTRHLRSGFALLLGLFAASCAEPTATSVSEAPDLATSVAPRTPNPQSFRAMPDSMLWRRIAEAGGVAAIGLKTPSQSRGMSADGRILVSPSDWTQAIAVVSAVAGVAVVRRDTLRPMIRARLANAAAVTALRALPHVDYVEPAIIVAQNLWAMPGCDDGPYQGAEHRYLLPSGDVMPIHFDSMNIVRAWAYATGAGVVIGLTDTGVDEGQQELRANFASGESGGRWVLHRETGGDGSIDCPHGTHVAGTIAAPRNGALTVGVAWRANLVSEYQSDRVFDVNNIDAQQAIDDAGNHGAKVIAMPFQTFEFHDNTSDAIKYWYYNRDVVFVAAAGTGDCGGPIDENNIMFPAELGEVLAVSNAWLNASHRPCQAHYGSELDVVAYHQMLATPMGYHTYFEGTGESSNATAVVAGVAALVRERYPTWTNQQVYARIKNTAGVACGRPNWADVVNAEAAVGGLCVYGGGIIGTDMVSFTDAGPEAEQSQTHSFYVSVTGGSGNYHIEWTLGQTGTNATYTFPRGTYDQVIEVTITDVGHGTAPVVRRRLVHVIDDCENGGESCHPECNRWEEGCEGGGEGGMAQAGTFSMASPTWTRTAAPTLFPPTRTSRVRSESIVARAAPASSWIFSQRGSGGVR
jgi:subtilase family protein